MFKPAERKQARFKMGLTGPSGSGKTYSALLIAKGLAGDGKIAVLDTENKSASLYAGMKDIPAFDVVELAAPYSPDRYIEIFNAAVQAGYSVLIVDSASHEWNGAGGILQQKEQLDARGGDSFRNWAKMTPKHDQFISAILHSDIHMICTIRSKQEYALTRNDAGKNTVQKLGMAPVQREGLEYELSTVLDLAMNHEAEVSKDRTGLFGREKIFKPSVSTGVLIREWLLGGAIPPQPQEAPKHQQPSQTPSIQTNAPLNLVTGPGSNRSRVSCEACGTELVLKQDKTVYYCPSYKLPVDSGKKHTFFPASALDDWRHAQSGGGPDAA